MASILCRVTRKGDPTSGLLLLVPFDVLFLTSPFFGAQVASSSLRCFNSAYTHASVGLALKMKLPLNLGRQTHGKLYYITILCQCVCTPFSLDLCRHFDTTPLVLYYPIENCRDGGA